MKRYEIQSKNGTMINIVVNVKIQSIGVLVKNVIHRILVRVVVSVIKGVEWMSI